MNYMWKQLENQVMDIEDRILEDLPSGAKILLAIDYWTSSNQLAFLAVNSYFIDSEWRYREVLFSFEHLSGSHFGIYLAQVLEEIFQKYNIAYRVLVIITDNVSNNRTLMKHLQNALISGNFNVYEGHLLYFTHVIQPSLKELLGKIRIEATNDEVEKTWEDDLISQINHVDGIGKTLARVSSIP